MSTIAAISTPQAPGGIGIVRISGQNACQVADRVFQGVSGMPLTKARGYTAHFGHVCQDGQRIDETVALVFRGPKSYTGEDVVELSCHGGLYIVKKILQIVIENGAILAQPGEFTKRAFLNGKMDLAQAEAVMDLISAQGKQAAQAAMAAKDGVLSRRIGEIRDGLLAAAAHLAAWADYPEEEIEEVTGERLAREIGQWITKVKDMLAGAEAGSVIRQGIDTVIVGRPNVGKSTIMNLLSGCDRSIVTEEAGTTRDVVEETVRCGEALLRLADTAGIRDSESKIEQIGIQKAKARMMRAQLVLAVFDTSRPLGEEEIRLIESLQGRLCIAVLNKSDLPQAMDIEYVKERLKHTVLLSAKDEKSAEIFRDKLEEVLEVQNLQPCEGILSTQRQWECGKQCLEALEQAKKALSQQMTLDAVQVCLDDAVSALLELTGERASEAVVDQVFHHFCVGK